MRDEVLPLATANAEGLETALAGGGVTLQPWDSKRFSFVTVLQQAPRNNGYVELFKDAITHELVAVKVMPLSWIRRNHEDFLQAHPDETEMPWRDIGITMYLSKVVKYCICDLIGVFRRPGGISTTRLKGVQSEAAVENDEEICMALSYCAGSDLFSWLEQTLPTLHCEREIALRPVMRRVMEAVYAIHSQGIAHGDLSLENVLLKRAEEPDLEVVDIRLIDFAAATSEFAQGVRGKSAYQAPELHLQDEYNAFAADVFSLGVMLFTLAVGNYPWKSSRPFVCQYFSFHMEKGFDAYLAKRKIKSQSNETLTLAEVLSPELASLLGGLLMVNAAERISIAEALTAPWFRP